MKGLLPAIACFFLASSAWGGFLRQDVLFEYHYPTQGNTSFAGSSYYPSSVATVDSDTEFSGLGLMGGLSIDLSDDGVFIENLIPGNSTLHHGSVSFNGIRLYDIGLSTPEIIRVTLNTTTINGFDSSRVLFDADTIWVNYQGLSYPDQFLTTPFAAIVSLSVVFAEPVPLPPTLSLILFGGLLRMSIRGDRRAPVRYEPHH